MLLIFFALFALAVHRGAGGEGWQRLRPIIRSAVRFALGGLVLSMGGWYLVFVVLSLTSVSGVGDLLGLLLLALIYAGFWGLLTAYFLAIPVLIIGAVVGFLRSRT